MRDGAIYGYNTAMFQLPSTGATIVVVANKSTNTEGIALETFVRLAQLVTPSSSTVDVRFWRGRTTTQAAWNRFDSDVHDRPAMRIIRQLWLRVVR